MFGFYIRIVQQGLDDINSEPVKLNRYFCRRLAIKFKTGQLRSVNGFHLLTKRQALAIFEAVALRAEKMVPNHTFR